MWAAYQKELWGYETLEVESGFIVYKVFDDHIFLVELYVSPEFRREGLGSRLTKEIEALAKKLDKKTLASRIDITQGGAADSLKAHLAYGFVPYLAESGKIWMKKETNL